MGGGHSHSSRDENDRKRKIVQQAEFIYPKFFIKNAVIEAYDINNIKNVWNYVSSNTSPEFTIQRAKNSSFPHASCMVWFFHAFYDRLFDVHPEVKPLFQDDILKQGHKLVEMISLIIDLLDKSESAVQQTLTKLVKVHHGFGVLPNQYNFVVETILYSLEVVVGRNVMDGNVRLSWLKCLSRMLSVMIPAALEASMSDVERKSKMSDFELSSSKSSESKTVSTGIGSLQLAGSCSMGNLLLRSERSSNDEYGEDDHKDPHEMKKRQALSISCPMGGGLHEGVVRWERNTLGVEEDEGEDEEVEVQGLERIPPRVPLNIDLGDAQMNI